MRVIICGSGKLGANLAGRLSLEGHEVVIIDLDEEDFRRLPPDYSGFTVVGDATEAEVLEQAGVREADVLVAATNYDNTNVMIAQLARQVYNVPRVVARVFEPSRETVYRQLGIDTVCPTTLSLEFFEELILSCSLESGG